MRLFPLAIVLFCLGVTSTQGLKDSGNRRDNVVVVVEEEEERRNLRKSSVTAEQKAVFDNYRNSQSIAPSSSSFTPNPTPNPSMAPTVVDTASPSSQAPPTALPTTHQPSAGPTVSATTAEPSTSSPTGTPLTTSPTVVPTVTASTAPTVTPTTRVPTGSPSVVPSSLVPTGAPSVRPSRRPTPRPTTEEPTASPSFQPTRPGGVRCDFTFQFRNSDTAESFFNLDYNRDNDLLTPLIVYSGEIRIGGSAGRTTTLIPGRYTFGYFTSGRELASPARLQLFMDGIPFHELNAPQPRFGTIDFQCPLTTLMDHTHTP